ncbi:MAG: hypothetical protein QOC89_5959 [Paraburkholderia sp.]|jgi:hypothetical protein|nr:hypothetical protein [Paraburkholderia sp.]
MYGNRIVNLRDSLAQPGATARQRAHVAAPDSLYRPANAANFMGSLELEQRGLPSGSSGSRPDVPDVPFGTTMMVMQSAATSSTAGNLYEASANLAATSDAGGPARATLRSTIDALDRNGEWSGDAREIPHYIRHPGSSGLRGGEDLVRDLENHFSTPYNPNRELMAHPETFALIGLSFRNSTPPSGGRWQPAMVMGVQRLHSNGDYRNDAYTLYSPFHGAFRYENFGQLAYALHSYYSTAFRDRDGFSSANTSYYAMQNVVQHSMAEQRLGAVGGSYGIPPFPALAQPSGRAAGSLPVPVPSLTPPRADLPALPDFDQPGPSGYQPPPRGELKRSADTEGERQPMALYRPSNVTPAALKKLGGFSAEQTPLGKVNLDMHNFDVATNPAVIDGAGYLGTFRKLETAQQNPALVDAKNGYVYAVAPTPNMVDVNASLGANSRHPDTGEVAAMGRIDYTQIRGWQKMENGKLGAFTANPDYRWDVYDQTRTAGAQPQLSRFAAGNAAWSDSAHRPFAIAQKRDGKTVYAPRQEPNVTQAAFYNHALEKITYLSDSQAKGLDYRGPVKAIPHNGRIGALQANVNDPAGPLSKMHGEDHTTVTVSYTEPGKGNYQTFRMGDDGRFHTSLHGQDEVLRVAGTGYLYLDYAPKDPHSVNGVFRYENNRLIHEEDGKVLTYSDAGYPYVSRYYYNSSYSQWKLTDASNQSFSPPRSIHSYRDSSAGSARVQYEFEKDPDSALPAGVTHFTTRLPSGAPTFSDANSFMQNTTQDQQQYTAAWLSRNNAALLFKDGFYLTAAGARTLEVRNLQGNTIRSLRTDAPPQAGASGIKSDYQVADRTWARLQSEQERREQFEDFNKTSQTNGANRPGNQPRG